MITPQKTTSGETYYNYTTESGKIEPLSSRYSPQGEAIKQIEALEPENTDAIFFLGGANIYLFAEAEKKFPNAILALIENQPELIEYASSRTNALQQKLHIFSPPYENALADFFTEHKLKGLKIVPNRAQIRLFPQFYEQARKDIIEAFNRRSINAATLSRFERVWIKNIYQNTPVILNSPGVVALCGIGTPLSALIVAAGPSLALYIEQLKKDQDRFFIIAVDTVYKTLLSHEIYPDIVAVVDPQKINSRYLENVPAHIVQKTIFIFEPAVHPRSIADKKGRCFTFDTIFPWYKRLCHLTAPRGEIDMGGSVATTAYEIARVMGFKQSAFLGLDLCFRNDAYHVPGTIYEEFWFSSISRKNSFEMMTFKLLDYFKLEQIITSKGETAYVDSRFIMFKNWFEARLKDVKEPTFFNIGFDGAPISGLPPVSYETFFETNQSAAEQKRFVKAQLESFLITGTDPYYYKDFLLKEISLLNESIQKFLKIASAAKETAQEILHRFPRKQSIHKQLELLEQYDPLLSRHFEGKELINIGVQDIINKITTQTKIDFEFSVPEELRAIGNSLTLYNEMVAVAQLNLRHLNLLKIKTENSSPSK